ncbi:hypothetical protein MA16_Dca015580 [Dendrobium catenatum]|uniref:Uncharacterized protein n=1 Tax=Dendrobium catenatum TaxID=906689 RepID=A0A2I0WKS4_9ASPA|nr:hypothetical protein MA16_Dca015580 [Dendrobium catenatum]
MKARVASYERSRVLGRSNEREQRAGRRLLLPCSLEGAANLKRETKSTATEGDERILMLN